MSSDLQCSQEVAGLPQSGPGGVQLLQQFVLRVLHRGDLSLGRHDVVLPLLHPLLQPSHLRHVGQGYPQRLKQIHNLTTYCCILGRKEKKNYFHQHFMQTREGIAIKNAFNNYFCIRFLNETGPMCFLSTRQHGSAVRQHWSAEQTAKLWFKRRMLAKKKEKKSKFRKDWRRKDWTRDLIKTKLFKPSTWKKNNWLSPRVLASIAESRKSSCQEAWALIGAKETKTNTMHKSWTLISTKNSKK